MSNRVKKSKYNFKIIRRFEEDIWGRLSLNNNKSFKTLNYIFKCYSSDFKYKSFLRKRNFFLSNKRDNFLYMTGLFDKELYRKKKTLKIFYRSDA